MAHVNIGADNADDAFYRYKMPKLVAKIEGRGNGIKTNIVNMVDVAKALSRPPAYTTKYFGCVLGAQSKFDDKTGTSTVNGAHDTTKLVQHLEGFIKTYVQCYGCGNPETEVLITKTQCITLKCAACGFLSDVDMRDKLTTFILKNPPEVKKKKGDKTMRRAEKERLKAGEALDAEDKKPKKDGKKKSSDGKKKKKAAGDDDGDKETSSPEPSQQDEAEDDEDDVEWQTDTSAEAAKKRIEEQLTAAAASMVMASAEESPRSKPVESPKVNGGSTNGKCSNGKTDASSEEAEEEDEQKEETEHDKLVAELVDYIQTHKLAEVADFVSKKERVTDLFIALVEASLNNMSKGFTKEFVKKKAVFNAVADDEESQKKLLLGIEHFFAVKAGAAAKEVALVLKALYDEEVLEEDVIVAWEKSKALCPGLSKEQCATVRKLSAPFIEWLAEADEDDDE